MERSVRSEMAVAGDQVQAVLLPPCGRSFCSDWDNENFVVFGNSNGLFGGGVCEKTTGAKRLIWDFGF